MAVGVVAEASTPDHATADGHGRGHQAAEARQMGRASEAAEARRIRPAPAWEVAVVAEGAARGARGWDRPPPAGEAAVCGLPCVQRRRSSMGSRTDNRPPQARSAAQRRRRRADRHGETLAPADQTAHPRADRKHRAPDRHPGASARAAPWAPRRARAMASAAARCAPRGAARRAGAFPRPVLASVAEAAPAGPGRGMPRHAERAASRWDVRVVVAASKIRPHRPRRNRQSRQASCYSWWEPGNHASVFRSAGPSELPPGWASAAGGKSQSS